VAAVRLPDQVMTNAIMLMDAGYQNRLPDQRVKCIRPAKVALSD